MIRRIPIIAACALVGIVAAGSLALIGRQVLGATTVPTRASSLRAAAPGSTGVLPGAAILPTTNQARP